MRWEAIKLLKEGAAAAARIPAIVSVIISSTRVKPCIRYFAEYKHLVHVICLSILLPTVRYGTST